MISLSKILDRPISRSGQKFDTSLLWMTVLMTVFSLVMIYSASIAYAAAEGGTQFSFVGKQALFVAVGVSVCIGLSFISMNTWKKLMPWYFGFSGLLLLLVLFLGREINGATRWIHAGPVNIQPTELFKLAVVLYLSSLFTRKAEVLQSVKKIMFPGGLIAAGLVLIMFQPDFGSFVVIVGVTMAMVFLAGFPAKYFIMMGMILASFMTAAIMLTPYRMARVSAFLKC